MTNWNNTFLQEGPIRPEQIAEIITGISLKNIGAYSIFIGQVRADTIDGKTVDCIEYSAYNDMVIIEMETILNSICRIYKDINALHVIHSIGKVKAGEISLLVIVACPHRRNAFRASEKIVEMIKDRLPVWKKEILNDGTYCWTQNKQ